MEATSRMVVAYLLNSIWQITVMSGLRFCIRCFCAACPVGTGMFYECYAWERHRDPGGDGTGRDPGGRPTWNLPGSEPMTLM
jgi:hypothetical protein